MGASEKMRALWVVTTGRAGAEAVSMGQEWTPERAFEGLGSGFYDVVEAARFPQHTLRWRDQRWAEAIGLGALSDEAWIGHFGRFEPLPGAQPHPLALRYHGHQFRYYNHELGDGRGFLFAQCRGPQGRLLDLGTKGSGQTPWSRAGDGRLTLKGGVREVLATTFLERLGVNTSRTLSLIETGERLMRHDEPSPTRSCVLVRLSHSHVRFGTFQRHAYERAHDRLAALVDYVARWLLPGTLRHEVGESALAVFGESMRRSADMVASWMVGGFVHGVLNTDNMNITGESFDYGPYRFLPTLDPNFVAAYFDQGGLYRFGYQPHAVAWNLARLADALSPIADRAALDTILDGFDDALWARVAHHTLRRLNLSTRGEEADGELASALLGFMEDARAPFQQVFFDWFGGPEATPRAAASPIAHLYDTPEFGAVRRLLRRFTVADPALMDDPSLQQPHAQDLLIDEIEAIWDHIDRADDWGPFHAKVEALRGGG